MAVVTEYGVPADDFFLGRATPPGSTAELDRLVYEDRIATGYAWVDGEAGNRFEETLRSDPLLQDLELVDDRGARRLYRVEFSLDDETFVEAIHRYDATLLFASGDDERWTFQIRFENSNVVTDFQGYCVNSADIALELVDLYTPMDPSAPLGSDLTRRQRETLLSAYERGYFEVPRRITLIDLADDLGISDQAVSERMRRGQARLIQSHLYDEE